MASNERTVIRLKGQIVNGQTLLFIHHALSVLLPLGSHTFSTLTLLHTTHTSSQLPFNYSTLPSPPFPFRDPRFFILLFAGSHTFTATLDYSFFNHLILVIHQLMNALHINTNGDLLSLYITPFPPHSLLYYDIIPLAFSYFNTSNSPIIALQHILLYSFLFSFPFPVLTRVQSL